MNTRQNIRKSFGFTLIELLVAIGILAILIGIVAFTVTGMTSGAKVKETKVRLESLNAMLTELESAAGLTKQPNRMYFDSNASPTAINIVEHTTAVSAFDIWRDGDPLTAGNQPAFSPGNVDFNLFSGKPPSGATVVDRARFVAPAVLNTQLIMGLLTGVPGHRTAIQNMPASSLLANPNFGRKPNERYDLLHIQVGTTQYSAATDDQKAPAFRPPILVDAWNNPIIYVPAAGLRDITFKNHPPTELHVINSTGGFKEQADFESDWTTYTVPPNARPFFASAGPDGDFSTGDDNVYSFGD